MDRKGHTDDLEKRLAQHHRGQIDSYTSSRVLVKLVYSEFFQSRDDAFVAERKVKVGVAKKKKL